MESVGWVVSEFFTPHAVLKYTLYDPATAAVKKFGTQPPKIGPVLREDALTDSLTDLN